VRFLFLADPVKSWSWFGETAGRRKQMIEAGLATFELQKWHEQALAQWTSECRLTLATQEPADVARLTGCWPVLIMDLFQFAHPSLRTSIALPKLAESLKDPAQCSAILAAMGFEDSRVAREVLNAIGGNGNNADDVHEYLNDDAAYSSRTIARALNWAEKLIGSVTAAGITIHSPCMRLHRWSGCVEPLDMLLYVSERIPGDTMTRIERDAAVSVVANLALWDPMIADRLLGQPLATILEPGDTLAEIARERGWLGSDIAASWEQGNVDRFDDANRKHSAWLAAGGDLDEIARRVWRGQISVLFPFIEERRLDLLDVLLPHLNLPCERVGLDGVIRHVTEARRLEMTDLSRQISSLNLAYVGELGRLVRHLKSVRNSLAHFAQQGLAVRAEELSRPEIRDWRGVLARFQSQTAAPTRARSGTGHQS
jgi:hypothetical protein